MELVSLPHFLHNFWRKIFLLLDSIIWPNFKVWLPLLCEILGNKCIVIVFLPGCDAKNFEINLIFLMIITYLFYTCRFWLMKLILFTSASVKLYILISCITQLILTIVIVIVILRLCSRSFVSVSFRAKLSVMLPNDEVSISRNVISLNIFIHDV